MNEKNLYDFSRINLEKICKFMDDADGVWQNQFARLFMDGVNGSAPYSSLNILFTFYKQSLYIYDLSLPCSQKQRKTRLLTLEANTNAASYSYRPLSQW